MTCKLCQLRRVPINYSSPRRCAFDESGNFTSDNWNCETMNELRGAYIWDHRDDNSGGSICVLPAGELLAADSDDDDISLGYLVLTYYKNRGTTSGARLVNNDKPDVPLTLVVAEHILKGLGIAP